MKNETLIICSVLLCVAVISMACKNIGSVNYFIVFSCYASIVAFAVRDYKKSKEHKS